MRPLILSALALFVSGCVGDCEPCTPTPHESAIYQHHYEPFTPDWKEPAPTRWQMLDQPPQDEIVIEPAPRTPDASVYGVPSEPGLLPRPPARAQ